MDNLEFSNRTDEIIESLSRLRRSVFDEATNGEARSDQTREDSFQAVIGITAAIHRISAIRNSKNLWESNNGTNT